jgi:uncharacterized protein (DUF2237 family)
MSLAASLSSQGARNVLGGALQACCSAPYKTGYLRDGFCHSPKGDTGRHTVCAVVTDEFLAFSAARGNELRVPHPAAQFPGLRGGMKWCLCVLRWREALVHGVAPPVILEATNQDALTFVTIEDLNAHKWTPQEEL